MHLITAFAKLEYSANFQKYENKILSLLNLFLIETVRAKICHK